MSECGLVWPEAETLKIGKWGKSELQGDLNSPHLTSSTAHVLLREQQALCSFFLLL
jgi:hypothetical protein